MRKPSARICMVIDLELKELLDAVVQRERLRKGGVSAVVSRILSKHFEAERAKEAELPASAVVAVR